MSNKAKEIALTSLQIRHRSDLAGILIEVLDQFRQHKKDLVAKLNCIKYDMPTQLNGNTGFTIYFSMPPDRVSMRLTKDRTYWRTVDVNIPSTMWQLKVRRFKETYYVNVANFWLVSSTGRQLKNIFPNVYNHGQVCIGTVDHLAFNLHPKQDISAQLFTGILHIPTSYWNTGFNNDLQGFCGGVAAWARTYSLKYELFGIHYDIRTSNSVELIDAISKFDGLDHYENLPEVEDYAKGKFKKRADSLPTIRRSLQKYII